MLLPLPHKEELMNTRPKPLGIVLVAIYTVLSGILWFFVSLVSIFLTAIPGISVIAYLLGALATASGIFSLAAVYGLWTLQKWGLKLTYWLYVIAIPLGIAFIFPVLPGSEITTENTVYQLVLVVIDMAVIFYLGKVEISVLYGDL
jgi:hypothetical protein